MYKTLKKVQRFNLNDTDQVSAYEAILNNPNALVLDRIKEKISDRQMDPETGRVISILDHLEIVVTWQERTLL